MVDRIAEVRAGIEEAQSRQARAEAEMERLIKGGMPTGPQAARSYKKLRDDWSVARSDITVLMRMLEDELARKEKYQQAAVRRFLDGVPSEEAP